MKYQCLFLLFVFFLVAVIANPLHPPQARPAPKCECGSSGSMRDIRHYSIKDDSVLLVTSTADIHIAVIDDEVSDDLSIDFDTKNSDAPKVGDQLLVMSSINFAIVEDPITYHYDVTKFYLSACGETNSGDLEFDDGDDTVIPDVTLFFWNGKLWVNSLDNC